MFFCRYQLLRAPAQRHFPSLLTTQYLSRGVTLEHPPLPLLHRHACLIHSLPTLEPSIGFDEVQDMRSQQAITSSSPRVVAPEDKDGPMSQETKRPTQAKRLGPMFQDTAVAYYHATRAKGSGGLRLLNAHHFTEAMRNAVKYDRPDVIASLVEDAVYICRKQSPIRGRNIIGELLRGLTRAQSLTKPQVLLLLQTLQETDQLRFIRVATRTAVARWVLGYAQGDILDGKLYTLIGWWLAEQLPKEGESDGQSPPYLWERSVSGVVVPRVLWPLYRILIRLAQTGCQDESSLLLEKLVAAQQVSIDAISQTDLSVRDYSYVVSSVLVRTCLMHGWLHHASDLLLSAASAKQIISPPFANLIEDWISEALNDPRDEELRLVASAIILLFRKTDDYILSNTLLQNFYEAAAEANMLELLSPVYRSSRLARHHSYLPPLKHVTVKFLLFLYEKARDVHLARVLVKQIVEENVYVSPSVRSTLIGVAATLGFTSQARTLWERYSAGFEGPFVVGDRAAMLRLVSAFVKAEQIVMRTVHRRWPATHDAVPSRINLADDQEEDVQEVSGQWEADGQPEDDDPASDAPHWPPSSPPPHENVNSDLKPSSDGDDLPALAEEESNELGFAAMTRSELLARAADLRQFADTVFDAYYKREPLEKANHLGLNALARGALMLGRDALALEVFGVMKKRGIQLDVYDLNVALAVVAKGNPVAAAARIQHMINSGIQPDEVTFGTVMHWAIYHGNTSLVRELLVKAKECGIEKLSFKTLGRLLHATVTTDLRIAGTPGWQLDSAQDFVDAMLDAGFLPTPNMGRDCVLASLRADEPVEAFWFWKQLINGKVEWEDAVHHALRASIARRLRRRYAAGSLNKEYVTWMLYELGMQSTTTGLYIKRQQAAQECLAGGDDMDEVNRPEGG